MEKLGPDPDGLVSWGLACVTRESLFIRIEKNDGKAVDFFFEFVFLKAVRVR